MRLRSAIALLSVGASLLASCSSEPKRAWRFPPREVGCDITLFHENPNRQTVNIGPVTARCADTLSDDECLRALKDETCKLGGDVVWGVEEKPEHIYEKNVWHGRAAHTKITSDAGH